MVDRKKRGKMKIHKFKYLKNEKSFLDEIMPNWYNNFGMVLFCVMFNCEYL